MGAPYRQFCPVAKAMELLDERWTLLLVRELVIGSERFNDLRRGLPRMSPALLSKRLQLLTRAGVVERVVDGQDVRYRLTEAGQELRPVVEALGTWGTRWIGDLGEEDLDPHLLMWDVHRNLDEDALPPGRTVVRFVFTDVPAAASRWWLVIVPGDPDVCDEDPGHDVDATVTTTLAAMTRVWRGDLPWAEARRRGELDVSAPADVRRALPGWFRLSTFAAVPRGDGAPVRVPPSPR
jgi:DNA-binding HxlR family transcriptional regulator